jgi:hypothetical protein
MLAKYDRDCGKMSEGDDRRNDLEGEERDDILCYFV